MLRFSFYIFAVALLLIYHFYLKYKRVKWPDQFRDRYFNRIICRLVVPFKDPKSNMYSEQKILSEYAMNMLYLVFIYSLLFCGIGLIIHGFLMVRKDVYRVMKRDLEYLLLVIRNDNNQLKG